MKLTQKRLKELLHYDPESGVFTRLVSRPHAPKGSVAGTLSKQNGYVWIRINYKLCTAGRLAFLYMKGYTPEGEVDHEDRVRSNNKWSNLREASFTCQARNKGVFSTNTSGVTGVYKHTTQVGTYVAEIHLNNKKIHLGASKDFTEAVAHRLAGEQRLDWPNCRSTSPAYQHMQRHVNSSLMSRLN